MVQLKKDWALVILAAIIVGALGMTQVEPQQAIVSAAVLAGAAWVVLWAVNRWWPGFSDSTKAFVALVGAGFLLTGIVFFFALTPGALFVAAAAVADVQSILIWVVAAFALVVIAEQLADRVGLIGRMIAS